MKIFHVNPSSTYGFRIHHPDFGASISIRNESYYIRDGIDLLMSADLYKWDVEERCPADSTELLHVLTRKMIDKGNHHLWPLFLTFLLNSRLTRPTMLRILEA